MNTWRCYILWHLYVYPLLRLRSSRPKELSWFRVVRIGWLIRLHTHTHPNMHRSKTKLSSVVVDVYSLAKFIKNTMIIQFWCLKWDEAKWEEEEAKKMTTIATIGRPYRKWIPILLLHCVMISCAIAKLRRYSWIAFVLNS